MLVWAAELAADPVFLRFCPARLNVGAELAGLMVLGLGSSCEAKSAVRRDLSSSLSRMDISGCCELG